METRCCDDCGWFCVLKDVLVVINLISEAFLPGLVFIASEQQ